MGRQFEIKLDDSEEIIANFKEEGFSMTGSIELIANGCSLTDGPRDEFVARLIIDLLESVPEILNRKPINIEFLEHPPDSINIHDINDTAKINVISHKEGVSVNSAVSDEGKTIPTHDLIIGIQDSGREFESIIKQSNITKQQKTAERFRKSISICDKAIEKSPYAK
ncbi:hypothetical protein [Halosimplex sp. TS25]|uniref:hypothetical protein n=1 Tax=Halosimplex rarum TaxID=3396619 RepID=UPI0039E96897